MSTLYLVSTPIGNLEDITLRALRVLGEVSLVAAEDTRHSGRLLQHFGIDKPLLSLHEHNEAGRIPALLAALGRSETVALITDAGTPALSDPGHQLVRAVIEAGHTVTPIPGPSALLAALVPSGLPTDRFLFLGFPPRRPAARAEHLRAVAAEPGALVWFESAQRLPALLQDIAAILGRDRRVVVARELTKLHESFWRGTAAEAAAAFGQPPLGEIVVLVSGAPAEAAPAAADEVAAALAALLAGGLAPPEAARLLASLTGLPRRALYRLATGQAEPGTPNPKPTPA
jgi:16S rRNA (cytidine1402-2'-O)-methyltransferase